MNRLPVRLAALVTLLLMAIGFFIKETWYPKKEAPPSGILACDEDADCFVGIDGCCECGSNPIPVSRKRSQQSPESKDVCGRDTLCPQCIPPWRSSGLVARCVRSRCTLQPGHAAPKFPIRH